MYIHKSAVNLYRVLPVFAVGERQLLWSHGHIKQKRPCFAAITPARQPRNYRHTVNNSSDRTHASAVISTASHGWACYAEETLFFFFFFNYMLLQMPYSLRNRWPPILCSHTCSLWADTYIGVRTGKSRHIYERDRTPSAACITLIYTAHTLWRHLRPVLPQ
jgi:hypothetical protein